MATQWDRLIEGYNAWRPLRDEFEQMMQRMMSGEKVDMAHVKALVQKLDRAHQVFVGAVEPTEAEKRAG